MKVFILADGSSIHTKRWVKGLSSLGHEIFLFSLNQIDSDLDFLNHKYSAAIEVSNAGGLFSKLKYLKVISDLKQQLSSFNPDLLHAHYASSYGLLGALTGFKPYLISVWGSDVYDFPNKSFLHKAIIKFNLSKAEKVLSTSEVMAKETKRYTDTTIEVTPFGIDLSVFKPLNETPIKPISPSDTVIGTVKTLETKYGIEYLLRAFKVLKDRGVENIKLLIVGKGSLQSELELLCKDLEIEHDVNFVGWVPYQDIPKYHNMIDIVVYPSILDSESFGVSVIESGACEKPVVVSNKGGLVEVVVDGITGLVAESENYHSFANHIETLLKDKSKREEMGKAARKRVSDLYDWDKNLKQMEQIYKRVCS